MALRYFNSLTPGQSGKFQARLVEMTHGDTTENQRSIVSYDPFNLSTDKSLSTHLIDVKVTLGRDGFNRYVISISGQSLWKSNETQSNNNLNFRTKFLGQSEGALLLKKASNSDWYLTFKDDDNYHLMCNWESEVVLVHKNPGEDVHENELRFYLDKIL
jgi:hypothetical protein